MAMVASVPGVGSKAGSAKRSRIHCSRSRQLLRWRVASMRSARKSLSVAASSALAIKSSFTDRLVGHEQLAQTCRGGNEQLRRLWPLFQDHGAGIVAPAEAAQESADPCIVLPGRAGEERQMAIGVAIVLVHVQVND